MVKGNSVQGLGCLLAKQWPGIRGREGKAHHGQQNH